MTISKKQIVDEWNYSGKNNTCEEYYTQKELDEEKKKLQNRLIHEMEFLYEGWIHDSSTYGVEFRKVMEKLKDETLMESEVESLSRLHRITKEEHKQQIELIQKQINERICKNCFDKRIVDKIILNIKNE